METLPDSSDPACGGRRVQTLSRREREIAGCVAGGLTNRDIAQVLEISEKTVEKHLTRTFMKLRLRSRAQLAIAIVSKEVP